MRAIKQASGSGNCWYGRKAMQVSCIGVYSLLMAVVFSTSACWANSKIGFSAQNIILPEQETRLRLSVHASGQSLSEVLTAINQQTSWRLSAAPSIRAERVIIEFAGSVPEFMQGIAGLFHYGWTPLQGQNQRKDYVLQALPKTLETEQMLRHLPYLAGMATLRVQTAKELEKLKGNPDADYQGAGEAWGKQFLTLLSPDQVAGLFENDFIAGTPGDLTPTQADALWRFVRSTLAATFFDERDKALLASLTPDKFRQMPIVISAQPEHEGGALTVNVPEVGSVSVTLHAQEQNIPQGVDPFEYMQARARLPLKTRSKTAVAVALPADWRNAIAVLRKATHKNIFSDCYLEPTPFFGTAKQFVSPVQERGWEALLDQVCLLRKKRWWADEKTIFLRDRVWYTAKIKEPSQSSVQGLTADIRGGRLCNSTLVILAGLPRRQLLTLLRAFWDAEFEVSETTLADFLAIYRVSSLPSQAQILSTGLALDRFDGVQMRALETLAPDSAMRAAAKISGADVPNLSLRLEQTVGDKTDADMGVAALHLRLYPLRNVPTQIRLVVARQEEPITPLLVTQVKE